MAGHLLVGFVAHELLDFSHSPSVDFQGFQELGLIFFGPNCTLSISLLALLVEFYRDFCICNRLDWNQLIDDCLLDLFDLFLDLLFVILVVDFFQPLFQAVQSDLNLRLLLLRYD